MKATVLIAVVALLVAGCGESVRHASTLQRLDSFTSILRVTSAGSMRVSDDWSRLAAPLAAANMPVVRRQAGVLLVDSNRLASHAGTAATRLRTLSAARTRSNISKYVNDLADALSAQWWEARETAWTAQLLRRDPLVQEGGDAGDLAHLAAMARRSASQAVRDIAASRRLRNRDLRLFRYVPVQSASTKEEVP